MISRPILLTVVAGILCLNGCAVKKRFFSRRDYSEMQDPFMESESVASSGSSGTEKTSRDIAGRASLNSSLNPSGTKSALRSDAGTAGPPSTGRVANASYPEKSPSVPGRSVATGSNVRSYQGPALSDFLSRKQTEKVEAAAETANSVATSAVSRVNSPERPDRVIDAKVNAKVNDEVAGFNSFLQQTTSTVNEKSSQARNALHESEQSVEDFGDWAIEEKKRVIQNGSDAAAAASSAPAAVRDQFKASAKQVRKTVDDAVVDFNSVEANEAATAQPLMKRYAEPSFDSDAAFEDVKKAKVVNEENPFDNPFDSEFETPAPFETPKPAPNRSATAERNARTTLDDSFQIDSGWKPSNMTHP